jgi:hypothetical protein
VAVWITTIDNYPLPIAVRSIYLEQLHYTMPDSEVAYRKRLFDAATGDVPIMLQPGDASIARNRFHIGTVASFTTNPNFEEFVDLAKELGLTMQPRTDNFVIWVGPCLPQDSHGR